MLLQLPPLTVDIEARAVRGPGVDATLTATEARLLAWLAGRAGETCPRELILAEVWGYGPRVVTRTLDTTLSRLRAKIEVDAAHPRYLVSVAGGGLRLERPAPPGTVGREAELASVEVALASARLVTLVGPGGVGKTHLARCVLRRQGALFCGLDTATTLAELVRGVGNRLSPAWDPRVIDPAALVPLLRAGPPDPLVLDNLEQVVGPAAVLVASLLEAVPTLRILATSREPLAVAGEHVVLLPALGAEAAAALFAARATDDADPSWRDRRALDLLLARVDRLPLAIELIAGWADTLPLGALASRLDGGVELLVSDRRDVPVRHRSLSRVVEDSIRLLGEEDAAALRAFAVFAGDFSVEAAEAVVSGAALLRVRGLARRSLLHAVPARPGVFRLFESVRRQVREAGTPASATGGLARFLARLGTDAALLGPAVERCMYEADLRAAILPALDAGDTEAAMGCARALAAVPGVDVEDTDALLRAVAARTTGPTRRWLELDSVRLLWAAGRIAEARARVVPLVEAPLVEGPLGEARLGEAPLGEPVVEVRTLLLAAAVEREAGNSSAAVTLLTRALAAVPAEGPLRGTVLADLGTIHARQGRNVEAERCLREGLELLLDSPDVGARASALSNLAAILRETGRDSRPLLHRALALHRSAGQRRSEGIVLGAMGIERLDAGDSAEARRCFDEAILAAVQAGARHVAAVFTANRAFVDRFEGDLPRACAGYEEALLVLRDIGDVTYQALALGNLGEITVELGREAEGVRMVEEALSLAAGGRFPKIEGVFLGYLGLLRVRAGGVDAGRAALARGEAILRAGGFRDELCRLLIRRGLAEHALGDRSAAEAWLAQAAPLRRGVPWVERLWGEAQHLSGAPPAR